MIERGVISEHIRPQATIDKDERSAEFELYCQRQVG
jgi:hypothetical protein